VALILPQASAMVSNTFSWRKAGFTYGFLVPTVLEAPVFETLP
jgi:hypothetical protein